MNERFRQIAEVMERAIRFIMEFYQVSWDTAVLYYWDEVECYMELFGVE